MSRIGNQPIKLPEGVTLEGPQEGVVYIKGPKGALSQSIDPAITVTVEKGFVTLTRRKTNQKHHKSLHGLYRALLSNMVVGVSEGFRKTLELVGVGYRASVQNNILELNLGYSHTIYFAVPPEVTVQAETVKGKNPLVYLEGIDKQLVGQVAAKLRSLRKVEPYKGKGIRFLGEQIRRKVGKTTAK
ncbi:MAG: 50S ribosomal protein L6 [Bacteroidota bacterium]